MDAELAAVRSHLKLARLTLEYRKANLEETTTKLSRHYNKIQHTCSMLILVLELEGFACQDPDMWDDEPDVVPF